MRLCPCSSAKHNKTHASHRRAFHCCDSLLRCDLPVCWDLCHQGQLRNDKLTFGLVDELDWIRLQFGPLFFWCSEMGTSRSANDNLHVLLALLWRKTLNRAEPHGVNRRTDQGRDRVWRMGTYEWLWMENKYDTCYFISLFEMLTQFAKYCFSNVFFTNQLEGGVSIQ